ncbi:VOC family protein [Acetobacter indonesiensis]
MTCISCLVQIQNVSTKPGAIPLIQFQKIEEVPTQRNRVHLDLRTPDLDHASQSTCSVSAQRSSNAMNSRRSVTQHSSIRTAIRSTSSQTKQARISTLAEPQAIEP